MKVIDLLNKIANGEEVPKKIKIETHIFTKYNYPMGDGTFVSSYESNNDGEYHINDFLYPQYLNDEIEILEEKKIPEKLDIISNGDFTFDEFQAYIYENQYEIQAKINEIIDYLKSKENKYE